MDTKPKSKAVNFNSFVNGLIKRCRYINGNELSKEDKQKIYDYILDRNSYIISNVHSVLNIRTAKLILTMFSNRTEVIQYRGNLGKQALSLNSARNLLNKLSKKELNSFAKIGDVYGKNEFNDWNYAEQLFTYIDRPEEIQFRGTLYGGGAGGGGGICGGNGKKNVTTIGGVGSNGSPSKLFVNKRAEISDNYDFIANGGIANPNKNSYYHEGEGLYRRNGYNGGDGESVSIDVKIFRGYMIDIVCGAGGAGGGGCATKINWDGTIEASAANGLNGGNGNGGNSWTSGNNSDGVLGGGGGSSGYKNLYIEEVVGTLGNSYRSNVGDSSYISGNVWNKGKGGRSTSTKSVETFVKQSDQPNTIGTGGYGGSANGIQATFAVACGGNAGNSGGFVADDSIKNYLIMFKGGVNK